MQRLLDVANSEHSQPASGAGASASAHSAGGPPRGSALSKPCVKRQNSLGNEDPDDVPHVPVIQVELERMSGSRAFMSHEYLMSCTLSSRGETDLRAVNPTLSKGQASTVLHGVTVAMLRASRISQCNQVVAKSLKLKLKVSKIAASKSAPVQAASDRLLQEGQRLAALATAVRYYTRGVLEHPTDGTLRFDTSGSDKVGEDSATPPILRQASLDTRFLAFEFLFGWILRKRQVDLVESFAREAQREVSLDEVAVGKGPSHCTSAIMGVGKSSCIGPLASLLLADGRTLVT